MHGIDVSRAYFFDWGLPWLRVQYPLLAERVAAGTFRGSQVFGADDELSRDHGWGPEFLLLLTEEDYAVHGEALTTAIQAAEPKEWAGFRFRYPDHGISVTSIDRYFTQWIGWPHPPADAMAWLQGDVDMREYELYLMCHGALHYDPLGVFTARREAFRHYPPEIRLRRIRKHAFTVWHYGQYNFCDRLRHRDDPVARQIAVGAFCEGVMRLCLALDEDYSPYWKWLAFEFRKSPVAVGIDPLLRALAITLDTEERCRCITAISAALHDLLSQHDLAYHGPAFHPHTLFQDFIRGPLKDYA